MDSRGPGFCGFLARLTPSSAVPCGVMSLFLKLKIFITMVICNYLHLNAGNASGSGTACSTFSSLLIVLTHNTKKQLYYTQNMLH